MENMIKKLIFVLLLLILLPLCMSASDKPFSRMRFSASYFGELILHPGATVGIDFQIIDIGKNELHLGIEHGGYHHKWYHNAIFQNYTLGLRLKSKKQFFFDPQLNFAFFLTQPDGDIYTTQYDDEYPVYPVEPNLKFGTALIFGWDLKDNPWEIFFGPDIYLESKVNYMLIPHLAFKAGVAYELRGEK